ncbi:MAG TPA: BNR-4 repeat-containing protein [Armatimonadaceae bacterium]|nr:BNR-4 repeat-containing protein [Armatimonadaceae bacterium]
MKAEGDAPVIELNDNGAWSWFMDERAIVHRGKLLVGSIRSTDKSYRAGRDEPHWGNCELAVHDLATGRTDVVMLHEHFEQDDHDGPALHVRPDGRVVALYTRHSVERKVFWRVSESDDLRTWGEERELVTPGVDHPPFGGDNVTYSNPWQPRAEGGRLYNFFRSVAHQQNWMYSDDQGETWHYGGMFLRGHQGYAPYFKYAAGGDDTLFFVGTEDHPRNFDNSVYAGFVRAGTIHQSDGRAYAPLSRTTEKSGDIWDLTPVFKGDADNVAWVIDLHLDAGGRPVCVFSVQKDGRGLPGGQGGFDHRYHYARWDGARWVQHEVAYAGTRLYAGEDDYTGLAAIDPRDADSLYISTDADPVTGEPLVSAADGQRHHELFHGRTRDGGATWKWTPVTRDSPADNLRPIVPIWDDPDRVVLIWMRGAYHHNQGPWDTRVVARILPRAAA